MLQLCREGKVDLIITKSISRLGRNTAVILQTVRELKNIGVEVRFEKENINTLSGDGELMLTVLSSFAQEESKNVSDNLKWRVKKKFERGELILNTTRFLGYDKDEHGDLIINPEEAEIVKRIYEEYLAGNGSFKITKLLNTEGIPTVTGSSWNETSVRAILKNEKYMGDVILQKTFIVNHLSKKKREIRVRWIVSILRIITRQLLQRKPGPRSKLKCRNELKLKGILKAQINTKRGIHFQECSTAVNASVP